MYTKEMHEELSRGNEVYYRIWIGDNKLEIVTMQNFDEYDYNQKDFLNTERYNSEQEAMDFINSSFIEATRFMIYYNNTFR